MVASYQAKIDENFANYCFLILQFTCLGLQNKKVSEVKSKAKVLRHLKVDQVFKN